MSTRATSGLQIRGSGPDGLPARIAKCTFHSELLAMPPAGLDPARARAKSERVKDALLLSGHEPEGRVTCERIMRSN